MFKAVMMSALVLFSISTTLADEIVIDGSSEETTRTSLMSMQTGMERPEQMQLAVALMRIQMADAKSTEEIMNANLHRSMRYDILGPKIDGMTHAEILELAKASPAKLTIARPAQEPAAQD